MNFAVSDLFSVLEDEHQEILSLFDRAENAEEGERRELLDEIKNRLVSHARSEEKTLYSQLRERAQEEDNEDTLDLVNESFEDHQEMDQLLEDLQETEVTKEIWIDKMINLKETFEVHMEDEEDDLFPQVRELLSDDDLEELLESYREAKAELEDMLPTQEEVLGRSA